MKTWSPDGAHVVAFRTPPGAVGKVPLITSSPRDQLPAKFTDTRPTWGIGAPMILLNVLHDDPVVMQLIVDPLDQDLDQVLELGVLERSGLDHGAFLVLLELVLLEE